ncbi:uncharacterized protein LOC129713623 [Leucoraja erinacea]|uniref:uncharacterized protein LOC129713623 n=1 Tax=Leucoraja erinaceus TaxID=7782 RepID=UPI002455520E|nr:uncharacterized protein LOC129713623 [Leucoraja erinacea]
MPEYCAVCLCESTILVLQQLSDPAGLVLQDVSSTPTFADEARRLFGDENQVEAKYGQVPRSGCRKPRVPALGEGATCWTSVTTSLPSDQSKDKRLPHPQWEPNDVIYSLAVEPQPRYKQPMASEAVDVVYTEVRVGQWREVTGSVAPDTPPRLSPNINARVKPPSPSHKAGVNPRPTSHPPLPHPPNLTASPSGNMSSVSTDNTYRHVTVAPAKRHQAKPDKDETRKRWFSDWKCK